MKIVILDSEIANPGDLSWARLAALGQVVEYADTPRNEVAERIGDAEVVITNKVPLPREVFEACPSLRYVGLLATGYNTIDIAAAKKHGVVVSNVPGYSTMAVAQHTIALLLEICNHVGYHSDAVQAGRWGQDGRWSFWDRPLMELSGKTMGIIGFGNIGRATGRIAAALGMQILATGSHQAAEGREIARYVNQDALLAHSDVVSLHCPLLPETRGMIDQVAIAKMRDGAILLNAARGPLVVEQDLADALNSGKLAAAGLDVTAKEPIADDSPLLGAKNCYITPHIAWVAKETRQRLLDAVVKNLIAFLDGRPKNVVNP